VADAGQVCRPPDFNSLDPKHNKVAIYNCPACDQNLIQATVLYPVFWDWYPVTYAISVYASDANPNATNYHNGAYQYTKSNQWFAPNFILFADTFPSVLPLPNGTLGATTTFGLPTSSALLGMYPSITVQVTGFTPLATRQCAPTRVSSMATWTPSVPRISAATTSALRTWRAVQRSHRRKIAAGSTSRYCRHTVVEGSATDGLSHAKRSRRQIGVDPDFWGLTFSALAR